MTCSGSPELAARIGRAFDLLIDPGEAMGVAVSGGSDSLSLLLAAHDWAQRGGRRIEAATVDHGLRPEAASEAREVQRICEGLGVPHRTLAWRPEGHVAQEDSRRARHRLLAGWAKERGLGVVALGHTRDDLVETVLMRIHGGSHWWGLSGPLPSGPSPAWPEGKELRLVRPLLALGREALRADLRQRGQAWIDDPGNESLKSERIRTRRLIARLPAEARERIARISRSVAGMRASVLAEARACLASVSASGNLASIARERLAAFPAEARLRLVEALVLAAGGAVTPPKREPLQRFADPSAGPETMTLAGALLRLTPTELRISRAPPRRNAPDRPPTDWNRARSLLTDPRVATFDV